MLNREGWETFLKLCLKSETTQLLNHLFDMLFTTEEKENLALRCLIVKALLEQKRTQREIAKELHVSIAKITRGSNEIKKLDEKLLSFLKKELID
jgi:TrpR family trp operon transcriptional repressor